MLRWREYGMELTRQWCDTKTCPDCGTVEAGNIKVFSYVEQRYYCTTCRHTFRADKHTFFETVRRPRLMAVEALALLVLQRGFEMWCNAARQDRKSTRLNSSHSQISY